MEELYEAMGQARFSTERIHQTIFKTDTGENFPDRRYFFQFQSTVHISEIILLNASCTIRIRGYKKHLKAGS